MKALSLTVTLFLCLCSFSIAQEQKKELGTARLKNEKGEFIANGKLEIVEGRVGLRGIKGAGFALLSSDLTDPPNLTEKKEVQGKPATVRITEDDRCILEDENFFFLFDVSYGAMPDYSSSFAINTRFLLPPKKTITLWQYIVTVGEGGGEVTVKHGTIVNRKNVSVKKAVETK